MSGMGGGGRAGRPPLPPRLRRLLRCWLWDLGPWCLSGSRFGGHGDIPWVMCIIGDTCPRHSCGGGREVGPAPTQLDSGTVNCTAPAATRRALYCTLRCVCASNCTAPCPAPCCNPLCAIIALSFAPLQPHCTFPRLCPAQQTALHRAQAALPCNAPGTASRSVPAAYCLVLHPPGSPHAMPCSAVCTIAPCPHAVWACQSPAPGLDLTWAGGRKILH